MKKISAWAYKKEPSFTLPRSYSARQQKVLLKKIHSLIQENEYDEMNW